MKPIYLDYAATTPIDPRVLKKMIQTMEGNMGNPSSPHIYGQKAREAVEAARSQVAALLQTEPSQIVWTSGATESINLAIKGAAHLYSRRGKHIITLKTEHKAVLDTCQHLEKHGYRVTYLTPQKSGLLDLTELEEAITDDTVLISIMHVNNESGVIQDIAAIADLAAKKNILYHVDAVQSAGKFLLDLQSLPVDLLSVSAHKVYGPKGIGALYLRKKPRIRVEPLIHGGGHEQGLRSGTLPTHQIVGMGEAFAIAKDEMAQDFKHVSLIRETFLDILSTIPNCQLNAPLQYCSPYILNLRFDGMLAEVLLTQTPMISTSTAAACQGKGIEGSYVLRAMGLTEEQAKGAIRFSFGRFVTLEEIKTAGNYIKQLFNRK